MKKFKLTQYALLFMACMAFGLISTITAQAAWDYDSQTGTGLITKDYIEYNEDGSINTEAMDNVYYSDYHWVSIPGENMQIDYKTSGSETITHLTADQLTLTYYGANEPEGDNPTAVANTKAHLRDGDFGLVYFDPDGQTGYYRITRKDASSEEYITVRVIYPEVGFYSSPEQKGEYIIDRGSFFEGEAKEVYLNLNDVDQVYSFGFADGTQSDQEGNIYPFTVYTWRDGEQQYTGTSDGVENYFTVSEVNGKPGWYKITLDTAITDAFSIKTRIWKVNSENEEGYPIDAWINFDGPQPTGLVAAGEQFGEEGIYSTFSGAYFDPLSLDLSLQYVTVTDGVASVSPITITDVSKLKVYPANPENEEEPDPANVPVSGDVVTASAGDSKNVSLTFTQTGTYYLAYDGVDGYIRIDAFIPDLGFFSTPERQDYGYGDDKKITTFLPNTTYKEGQVSAPVYMLPWVDDNVFSINPDTINFEVLDENGAAVNNYITKVSLGNGQYQIATTDKATGNFTVKVTANRKGGETENGENVDPEFIEEEFTFTCIPVTKLEITTAPTKTIYTEGEVFDKTGMVVKAVYQDGSSEVITNYTVSSSGVLTTADKQVTITWNGKTAVQVVTVNAKQAVNPTPVTPVLITPTPENTTKIGDTVVLGGVTYRVTNVNKKEVACVSAKKSVKKVNILSAVTVNGTSYNVTEIAANAFKNCTKLTTITISSKVKTIGKNAFSGCKKVKTITIKSKNITKIGKNAFKNVKKNVTIKVPKSKKAAYKKLLKNAGFKGKVK